MIINKAIKGSRIPIVIEVDGLGIDLNVNSENVGLECTFYCIYPMETYKIPKTFVIGKQKEGSVWHNQDIFFPLPEEEGGDGNQYIAIVDTSQLDVGRMYCGVKVTYFDSNLNNEQIVEISPADCNVKIIDPYPAVPPSNV